MNRKAPAFFIFLILCLSQISVILATESFNELELRNPFTDNSWYAASTNIIRNTTLNAYQFNTSLWHRYENFSTYTEVDAHGDITVTDYKVDINGDTRTGVTYVYYDYGAGYFTDFVHEFEIEMDILEGATNQLRANCWALWESLGPRAALWQNEDGIECEIRNRGGGSNAEAQLAFKESWNGGSGPVSFVNIEWDTKYYLRVNKTGAEFDYYIYDDVDRTNLVGGSGWTLHSNADYRYVYALQGLQLGGANNDDFWIENLNLNAEVDVNGVLYFDDVLENTTNDAVWYSSNSDLNGSLIQVSFSGDNNTWVGLTSLDEGYDAVFIQGLGLSTLYVRHNFTYIGYRTPYLNNVSVWHFTDAADPADPAPSITALWLIIAIIFMLLGVGIGERHKNG